MDLSACREQIDEIDAQLVDLFVRRMHIAKEIAAAKAQNGKAVFDRSREREVLARATDRTPEELQTYTKILYATLFDLSRSYQKRYLRRESALRDVIEAAQRATPALFPQKAVVACQGIEGAYSQQAADKLFALPSIVYFQRFEGVFQSVERGLCQYGLLPIENSSYGSVNEVYDLMKRYRFFIAKSFKLRVRHVLLGRSGSAIGGIREIFSHEQAIGQCGRFIKSLGDVKVTVCENTAVAARRVAESGRDDAAAISSRDCAALYGLSVLSDSVQDSESNYTRFICISKELEIYPGANRISLMLSVPHRPGSLYRLISRFSAQGVNLSKIESRPIPGSDFEFMFYFDLDASLQSPEVVDILCELADEPEQFAFLGSYSES